METCPEHLNIATDLAVTKATAINTNVMVSKLADELKDHRDFSDHKVVMLEERLGNWMTSTVSYRKDLCSKLDHITNEILKVNDRCIYHIAEAKEFKDHIEESKKNKSVFKDRRFQLVLMLSGFAWAFMFWILQSELFKLHK